MKLKLVTSAIVVSCALLSFAYWLNSAWSSDDIGSNARELVMHDDVKIEVDGPNGSISVYSSSPLERRFNLGGCSLQAKLRPRAERWYGLLGAYDPAGSFLPRLTKCNGVTRVVAQEGQLHFDDQGAAERYLIWRSELGDTTWTSNGLIVTWIISTDRNQLNFDVIQICLNGELYRPNFSAQSSSPIVTENAKNQGIRTCERVSKQTIETIGRQLDPLLNQE